MNYIGNIFLVVGISIITDESAAPPHTHDGCDGGCDSDQTCCCWGSSFGGRNSCGGSAPPQVLASLEIEPEGVCACVDIKDPPTCHGDEDCSDGTCCCGGPPPLTIKEGVLDCIPPIRPPISSEAGILGGVKNENCFCLPRLGSGGGDHCGGGGLKCGDEDQCCCNPPSKSQVKCGGGKLASAVKNIKPGSCTCLSL